MTQIFAEKQDQQSLSDDGTITFELPSGDAVSEIAVLVDDGAGGTPAGYQIDFDVYDATTSRYKPFSTVGSDGSPTTEVSHVVNAVGPQTRVTVTNRSAGSATFDCTAKAKR